MGWEKPKLEDLAEKILELEQRVSRLEYKMEKVVRFLEKYHGKSKVVDVMRAFTGEGGEFRIGNKVIIGKGIIYIRQDIAKALNLKLVEEQMDAYVISDNIEGVDYKGIVPKFILDADVEHAYSEDELVIRLKEWMKKYGKRILSWIKNL